MLGNTKKQEHRLSPSLSFPPLDESLSEGILQIYFHRAVSANLLYGFEPLHVQNTSRRGGTRCRGSAEHLGRLEEDVWRDRDPERLGSLEVDG